MTREEYIEKSDLLRNSMPAIGEVINVLADQKDATVRICQHTGQKYVMIAMDCIVDYVRGPIRIVVGFDRYRGPALKCYLEDQINTDKIRSITVTRVSAKSITGRR